MMKPLALPDTIALFPLPGALLLPRARLPLHIFEPRYLAMIEDALATPGRLIGMIQPRRPVPGSAEAVFPGTGTAGEAGPALSAIGCAGRISAFSETEDGRYMITLAGVSRFRLRGLVPGHEPYLRAHADWQGFERDQGPAEADPGFAREAFIALLGRYFSARSLAADWGTLREAEGELLVNSLSMLLPLDPEERQALLESPTLSTRRETLVALIEFALRGGAAGEELRQ